MASAAYSAQRPGRDFPILLLTEVHREIIPAHYALLTAEEIKHVFNSELSCEMLEAHDALERAKIYVEKHMFNNVADCVLGACAETERGTVLVGVIHLTCKEGTKVAKIAALSVEAAYRGLGVGTALIKFGMQQLKEKGIKECTLTFSSFNAPMEILTGKLQAKLEKEAVPCTVEMKCAGFYKDVTIKLA